MIRRRSGFTLIEILIAIGIVGFVLAAASTFFVMSVRQYAIQTKITETNLEGNLGLELLRRDLDNLGFGLPWNNLPSYTERTSVPTELSGLNDGGGTAPRAVAAIDNAPANISLNRSDYLVVKSASVGMAAAAGKWTTLDNNGSVRPWSPNEENFSSSDKIIVLALGSTDTNRRSMVRPSAFYLTYSNIGSSSTYWPVDPYVANIIYGIDNGNQLARPFNRADYFIAATSTSYNSDFIFNPVPTKCAPNTGVLVKAVIPHNSNGDNVAMYPLLDCAADMQVAFRLDNTWMDPTTLNGLGLTAATLRARLTELRVSVLAHEGGQDNTYTHPVNPINVEMTDAGQGRPFTLTADMIHYRWKVYNLVIKPWNLAQ